MPKTTRLGPSSVWGPAPEVEVPVQEATSVPEVTAELEPVVPDPQPVKRASRSTKVVKGA